MPYNVLRDEELVNDLLGRLTDFEFEMLLRKWINRAFTNQMILNSNMDEGHNYCSFTYKWDDQCKWEVAMGSTYRDRVNMGGEVLTITIEDCADQWKKQNRNKLSLLLPPT